jgi:hypothetical protein
VSERAGWTYHNDPVYWNIKGKECEITIEPRAWYCDRGNWLAKIFPTGQLMMDIDDQDGWPRYYFDLDRAMLEVEAWLIKRQQWMEPSAQVQQTA